MPPGRGVSAARREHLPGSSHAPMSMRMKMQFMPKALMSLMGIVVRPAPDMADICACAVLSAPAPLNQHGWPRTAMKIESTMLSGGLGSLISMMAPKKVQVPSTYARCAR